MALVTRLATASMDVSTGMIAPQLTGLIAGEDLDAVAPCYIKSSDGKVYMTNATAQNEAAEVVGFTPRAAKAGQPITLFGDGTRFSYGSGLTPGNVLYAGATKGRLDDGPTLGDPFGVAEVVTATEIRVSRARITQFNNLDGSVVANVGNANVTGGLVVLHTINVADASANTDVVLTHKERVIDAWGLNTGIAAHAANDTWQVKNGADAISDAVAKTATVNGIKRISTIDPAKAVIAAGGTLRIAAVKDTNAAVTVYVLCIRVA